MKQKDSEKIIERRLVKLIKANGGMCVKLICDQLTGLPDRMCLMPNGVILFVELKSTGQKPRPRQMLMHNKLRALGFRVEVIDTINGINCLINEIIKYEN